MLTIMHCFPQTHDPRSVHFRSPAYAFGIRHGKMTDDCSPGPCHLPEQKIYRDGRYVSTRVIKIQQRKHTLNLLHATLSSGTSSTSNSSSSLSIHLHRRPTTSVLLSFLVILFPRLYSARWCSPGLHPLSPHVPCSPNHLTFLLVTISSSVSYFIMCFATLVCISTLGYALCNAPATVFGGNCFGMPECDVYSGTARRTTRSTVGVVDQHPSKRRVLEPTHPRRADPLPTIGHLLTHSGPALNCDTQTAPQVGKSGNWHH